MNETSAGSGCRLSSKLCRAQLPATHSSDISPGTPARLSRTSASTLGGQQHVVGAGRQHRAAHGDDPGDQVGPPDGQAAGEHAAEAVPDDADPAAALDRDRLDPGLELGGRGERAADVGVDVGAVGAEAAAAQGAAHRAQRGVAGHEARDQDHRLLGARHARGRRTTWPSGGAARRATRRRSGRPRARRCSRAAPRGCAGGGTPRAGGRSPGSPGSSLPRPGSWSPLTRLTPSRLRAGNPGSSDICTIWLTLRT